MSEKNQLGYYEPFIHLSAFVLGVSLIISPKGLFYSCANLIACFFVLSFYWCLCLIHWGQDRCWRNTFYISLVWLANLILQGYHAYMLSKPY